MRRTLQTMFLITYFSVLMMVMGGALLETFVSFPNWFHHIPESLAATRDYYQVRTPGLFFQILMPINLFSGLAFIIAGWRIKLARNLVLLSAVLTVATNVITLKVIYPRITILISEGAAQHSIEFLNQTANQFLQLNYLRLVILVVSALCSLVAVLKFFQSHQTETI